MGGKQNLLKQHKPGASKACQRNLEKKRKADSPQRSRASQPGIQSFFMKQPKVLVPPAIPPPIPVIAHAMESTSETHTTGIALRTAAPLAPKTHAVDMFATLEKAVGNIPNFVPPIATPPITSEPSGSEVIFLDSEPTRVGCGRKCGDMSGLSLCLCGESAQLDDVGSIQCERTGCETVWVSSCSYFVSSRLNRLSITSGVLGMRMQLQNTGLASHAQRQRRCGGGSHCDKSSKWPCLEYHKHAGVQTLFCFEDRGQIGRAHV